MVLAVEARLRDGAVLPAYQTAGAAGMDLSACLEDGASITLAPGQWALVPTGLSLAIAYLLDIHLGFSFSAAVHSILAWVEFNNWSVVCVFVALCSLPVLFPFHQYPRTPRVGVCLPVRMSV